MIMNEYTNWRVMKKKIRNEITYAEEVVGM